MNRENIKKVRDVIAALPAARFAMDEWSWNQVTFRRATAREMLHGCGTVGCIAGWATALADPSGEWRIDGDAAAVAEEWLELDSENADALFTPRTIRADDWTNITRAHAVRVLDHLLETGEVDWKSTRRAKASAK